MRYLQAALRLTIVLGLLCIPLTVFAAELPKLAGPPVGERWFSVNVGGERVGFAHLTISETPDGYRIDSDGSVKMRVMTVSREATTRESYLVGRNLAIRSFSAESRVDGKPVVARGEVTSKGIKVTIESDGKKERTLKSKGAVYPPPVLNFYPLLQGTPVGKTVRLAMLDAESVKITQVKVEVVGLEPLSPDTPSVHLRNNLYPIVDNDIWVDLKGNTLRESVRDDLVLTVAEDPKLAKSALVEAALSKNELALEFSLIRVVPPLERPAQLKKLSVEFSGIPVNFPLLQGKSQQAVRVSEGTVRYTMPNLAYQAAAGEQPTEADLAPSPRIPADDPQIQALKVEIAGAEKDPAQVARLVTQWVAKEIKPAVTGNQSPLEALQARSGNSQSRARLYAALARSAGIPTRLVSGLVYAPQGFLYHSWAESYLNGGWVSVDPNYGELPANLTHIKLVQGDTDEELAPLAEVIGRIKAKVVEQSY